jgi:GH43 family beta-xylosidase
MSSRIVAAAVPLVICAGCGGSPSTPIDAGSSADVREPHDAASMPRGSFRNPLGAGPDPFLRYHDGHYYLATTQGDAIRMWKARSLGELATAAAATIWQDTDPSRNQHVWAPAFYRFDGRWYVYYTADDGIDEHHRLYVIESDGDDPLGPYHFKAKLEPPGATDLFAIDPEILEQATGRYLLWSGAGSEGHNLIYIAPLGTPWAISGPRTYLSSSGGCSEVREAPAILQRAGTTFLVYSTCDTGKPDYQLWMKSIPMTSDPLVAAAWTQHPQPILWRNDTGGVWGPGSNGFFKSPDGSEDWIVYHAKNTTSFTYDFRTTRAQRIEWIDNIPVVEAVAIGTTLELPSGDPGRSAYFIDDDGTASGPGSVTFSPGWTAYPSCGVQCFRGDDHGSAVTGATATFRFAGTQIALYSVRDAGNGIAAFSIDGGPETMRDQFASIRQGELPIYTSPPLAPGEHELRVRVTGQHTGASMGPAISIDRAEVLP